MRNPMEDTRRYEELESLMTLTEEQRAEYKELTAGIEAEGRGYAEMIRLTVEQHQKGNTYPDLGSETWHFDHEEEVLAAFKAYGIRIFTFSSSWTDALDSAWKLQQAGATMHGMIEVNGRKDWHGNSEKRRAILFTLD